MDKIRYKVAIGLQEIRNIIGKHIEIGIAGDEKFMKDFKKWNDNMDKVIIKFYANT